MKRPKRIMPDEFGLMLHRNDPENWRNWKVHQAFKWLRAMYLAQRTTNIWSSFWLPILVWIPYLRLVWGVDPTDFRRCSCGALWGRCEHSE